MRKRKILIISILSVMFLSFGLITYAYFVKDVIGGTHGISSSPDDTKVVEVSTYNEFIKEVYLFMDDTEFNSDDNVSTGLNRKTIKLTDNIKLLSNIIINADCHINLNSMKLDLNGFNITFRYHYDGLYSVYGGTITDGSVLGEEANVIADKIPGSILIDCPNAIIDFDEAIIDERITIALTEATDEQIVNSAMNMVLANIQNTGINDFYTISNLKGLAFEECPFEHSSVNQCLYTYTDLDLIHNYYTYKDLSISYASSNELVLSKDGNVIIPTETTTVDLTVTITYGEVTLNKVISVHVVVGDADYASASVLVLNKNLFKYYNEETGVLLFENTFLLPKDNSYFGTQYVYTLKTNNPDYSINSENESDFFNLSSYEDYIIVSLSKEIVGIEITSIKGDASSTSSALPLSGESTTLIDDNHSYAINIVRELYGNQIFIRDGQSNETTYTERDDILIDPTINGYTRIKSIHNELINNNEGSYELLDFPQYDIEGNPMARYQKYQLLRVNTESEIKPYIGQSVFLSITFSFTERYGNEEITIQVPLIFEPGDINAGESFAAFDPYYVYFDNQFRQETGNYGYDSFSLPLSFDGERSKPTYKFIVFEETLTGEFIRLKDGELFTQSTTEGTNSNFTKDTMMNVNINPYYIKEDTLTYHFAYVPTYVGALGNIYYYDQTNQSTVSSLDDININLNGGYPYVSKLIIPGIVRYQSAKSVSGITEVFADKEFYAMAYSLLNDGELYEEGKFILTSRLTNQINDMNFMNKVTISLAASDTDASINSLKGIDRMTGIRALSLQNITLSPDYFVREIEYISKITSLSILNLSNTGIYDQTSNTIGLPQGASNDFLETLSGLTNLEELYLANNKIYYFDELANFASLKKVDISNNSFTSSIGWGFIDNILTDLANSLYGTFGANNMAVITTLESNGVEVIREENPNDDLQQEMKDIVKALSSLEYQDRLDKDVDISNLFELYPSGSSDEICLAYGISNAFVVTVDSTEIRFVFEYVSFTLPEGEENPDAFIMNICYHWYYDGGFLGVGARNDSVVFTYEYKVTRY